MLILNDLMKLIINEVIMSKCIFCNSERIIKHTEYIQCRDCGYKTKLKHIGKVLCGKKEQNKNSIDEEYQGDDTRILHSRAMFRNS